MAKSEWGGKHKCVHCGTVFYDMQRSPIVCPGCGKTHHPEVLLKSRRSRGEDKPVPVAPVKRPPVADEVEPDDELEIDDEADDDDLIEDASELADDDDDEFVGVADDDSKD